MCGDDVAESAAAADGDDGRHYSLSPAPTGCRCGRPRRILLAR